MPCPRCQNINPAEQRYCGACGAPLHPAQGEAREMPAGERRMVTVLFADIAGFTTLAEQLDPEQVSVITGDCLKALTEVVEQFDGWVDKYLGDAMMVVFGAPLSHEDDAARALRCALGMLTRITEFNTTHQGTLPAALDLHIGVNSGLVIAGPLGSEGSVSGYTVMGDAVNLASRLQQLAATGEILVGETTYQLTAPLFEWHPLGATKIRGKADEVLIYQVLRAHGEGNQMRGLGHLRAPMVGRAAELQLLTDVVLVLPSQGRVVLLLGEPGLGKSRLLAEVCQFVATQPSAPLWAEGRCLSYGQRLDYYPWREIVSRVCELDGSDAATMRAQLKASLQRLGVAEAAETQADLARLLGIASEGATEPPRHIAQSVLRLLTAHARVRPTIVVLEDLHWADHASLALLESMLRLPPVPGLLLIVSSRLEGDAGLMLSQAAGSSAHILTIQLQPLSPAHSRDLVAALLQLEGLSDTARQLILDRAEGNPFYVEEVIRNLLERQLIYQDGPLWRASNQLNSIAIPPTLVGIISARIDVLPARERTVLQVAAVLGRRFSAAALATLLDSSGLAAEGSISSALNTLTQRELVWLLTEGEYSFKHALTQEVAYSTLLLEHRRYYHHRAAEYYRALSHPLAPQGIADLTNLFDAHYHYIQAQEYAAAYALLGSAAAQQDGAEVGLTHLLVRWGEFSAYRKLLEELPSHLSGDEQLDVTRRLGLVNFSLGDLQAALEYDHKALALVEELGLREEQASIHVQLGRAYRELGEVDAAFSQYDRALQLAGELRSPQLEEYCLSNIGNLYRSLGEMEMAIEHYSWAVDICRQLDYLEGQSYNLANIGWGYIGLGDGAKATRYLEQALTIVRQLGDTANEGGWLGSLGYAQRLLGNYEQALELSKQALEIARKAGERQRENNWLGNLGWIYHEQGDYQQAQGYYEQALSIAQQIANRHDEATWHERLGLLYLDLAQPQRAHEHLSAALDIATALHNRHWQALLQDSLARAATPAARTMV